MAVGIDVAAPPIAERTQHPFLTYDMIYEIPEAIKQTLQIVPKKSSTILGKLKSRSEFYFTGCGTAFHSAMLGANILSLMKQGFNYECVQALELSNYHHSVSRNSAAFGVSHSGITKTTLDALRSVREQGAHCIGISHFSDRPISQVVDENLVVGNGPDKSRCHTKCYVSSAIALTQIALGILEQQEAVSSEHLQRIRKNLEDLPELSLKVLRSSDDAMKAFAKRNARKRTFYFTGSGPSYPNALETALKVMESSYVPAQGFETEQFLHGPWVSLDAESVVFAMATDTRTYARSLDLVKAATNLGANVLSIVKEGDKEMARLCKDTVELPVVDEQLSPFLSIIPLYLYSYYMSLELGINPDYIHYLTPAYWKARQIIFPPGTH